MSFASGNVMFIQLERNVYEAGDQVNGSVMMNVNSEIYASALCLIFNGDEYTNITVMKSESYEEYDSASGKYETRTRSVPRNYTKNKLFYKTDQTIYNFPGGLLPAGQYLFPFSFVLGTNIPNSFAHFWKTEGTYQNEALIKYILVARLIGGKRGQIPQDTVKTITIQNLKNSLDTLRKIDDVKKVYFCCCQEMGEIRLVTYFEKDKYYVNEEVYVVCEVDNSQGQRAIEQIDLVLTQNLGVKAGGESIQLDEVVARNSSVQFIEAGSRKTGQAAIRLMLNLSAKTNSGSVTQPTVFGDLIKCNHTIAVRLHLKGCCLTEVSNKLIVNLYSPPPIVQVNPIDMRNFNPVTQKPIVFHPVFESNHYVNPADNEFSGSKSGGINYPKFD